MSAFSQQTCLLTGATGYLGSCVKHALQGRDWNVVELSRRPAAGGRVIPFQLGNDVPASALTGARALVHCAYDFTQLSWPEIHRVNVAGSVKLLSAAREANVETLVYISSISAFAGCRSLYGRAKLETERFAHSVGAIVVRPGLIWGVPAGAMFKSLSDQVERSRVVPLTGASQRQYLVHQQDAVNFVARVLDQPTRLHDPITLAHEKPWTIREIVQEIAAARGKRITTVAVPWRAVWTVIKAAEIVGVSTGFRSDSLVSLIYQNPTPSFALQRELNVSVRPFALRGGA
jgi:nucleoside-diphosphate-sugar epimerase